MNRRWHRFLIIFAWLASSVAVEPADSQAQRIILEHADTLHSRGESRRLVGNVRVRRGAAVMKSREAIYQPAGGVVDLTGDVSYIEPGRILNADHITFYERTGNFDASGAVDFHQADSIRLRCSVARYYDADGILELYDDVIITSLTDGAVVTGERGRWMKGLETAIVEGDVVYRRPEQGDRGADTLVIRAQRLEYYQPSSAALFTGDVDLTAGDLTAVSDSLFYYPDSLYTILSGAPVIWRGTDKLSGRNIRLNFHDRQLRRIFVAGDGLALSEPPQDPGNFNRLAADTLFIDLPNDSLRIVTARGNAQGEYYVYDEDDRFQGVNLSAADVIELSIVGDRTESIRLSGASNGAFYPPGFAPELSGGRFSSAGGDER